VDVEVGGEVGGVVEAHAGLDECLLQLVGGVLGVFVGAVAVPVSVGVGLVPVSVGVGDGRQAPGLAGSLPHGQNGCCCVGATVVVVVVGVGVGDGASFAQPSMPRVSAPGVAARLGAGGAGAVEPVFPAVPVQIWL
jgi:hypothetical protein